MNKSVPRSFFCHVRQYKLCESKSVVYRLKKAEVLSISNFKQYEIAPELRQKVTTGVTLLGS